MSLRELVKRALPAGLLPVARRAFLFARGLKQQLRAVGSRRRSAFLHARDSRIFQMSMRGSMNQACCEMHVMLQYRMLVDAAEKVGKRLEGRILEIGACGHPGMALVLLLGGADKVWLNNVFPIVNRLPVSWAENAYVLMRLFGTPRRRLDAVVDWLDDGHVRIKPALIELPSPCPCEELIFADDSFDLIFSNAVLEHVRAPLPVLRNIHRMLAPDGWYAHSIDLRDHRDFTRPLEFLRLNEADFQKTSPDTNRHRASDWLRDLHEVGFAAQHLALATPHPLTSDKGTDGYQMVLQSQTDKPLSARIDAVEPWLTAQARSGLAAEFQSYDLRDLSVTTLIVGGSKLH